MTSIHSEQYRLIIDRLKKARIDAGLNQAEVANLIGKPQSHISKIETYQRRVDILELKVLAKLYGVDIDEII